MFRSSKIVQRKSFRESETDALTANVPKWCARHRMNAVSQADVKAELNPKKKTKNVRKWCQGGTWDIIMEVVVCWTTQRSQRKVGARILGMRVRRVGQCVWRKFRRHFALFTALYHVHQYLLVIISSNICSRSHLLEKSWLNQLNKIIPPNCSWSNKSISVINLSQATKLQCSSGAPALSYLGCAWNMCAVCNQPNAKRNGGKKNAESFAVVSNIIVLLSCSSSISFHCTAVYYLKLMVVASLHNLCLLTHDIVFEI